MLTLCPVNRERYNAYHRAAAALSIAVAYDTEVVDLSFDGRRVTGATLDINGGAFMD
jgi:hypothetical protein